MKRYLIAFVLAVGILTTPILAGSKSFSGDKPRAVASPPKASTPTSAFKTDTKSKSFSGEKAEPADKPRAAKTTFNAKASDDQKQAESQRNYDRANRPKADYTYKTPKGESKPVEDDTHAKHVQDHMDDIQYERREQRRSESFGSPPPTIIVVHNDSYHPHFTHWLSQQPYDTQAAWVYNHRSNMDQARYDSYMENAELRRRVEELEAKGTVQDSNYTPPGISPDLMHTDDYVAAVHTHRPIHWGHIFWVFIKIVFVFWLTMLGLLIYLAVCYSDWRKQENA